MDDKKIVEVPVAEYEKLIQDQMMLQALIGAGVDNWDGYDYAMEEFEEMTEERDD